jgi:nicotinamidase-related amidase
MNPPSRALVILDVQNEFMSAKGNFPIPEDCRAPLVTNLTALIPRFRDSGGHIIWVQAIYPNREKEPAGMTMYEKGTNEWLQNATHVYHIPCCEAGTFGAEIDPEVFGFAKPEDAIVTKNWYSAFHENTALLDALRGKGVEEVFFTGLASGTCVLATILDAIKLKDLKVYAVPDCMGWRRYNTHVDAIERLQELEGVQLIESADI